MDWKAEAVRMKLEGCKWSDIIDAVQACFPGIPRDTIKERVRMAVRRELQRRGVTPGARTKSKPRKIPKPGPEHKEEWKWDEEKGEGYSDRLIDICEGERITNDALLRAHNLDPAEFQVVTYTNNRWHSQTKLARRLVMYQSKVTVKPRVRGISLAGIDEHFRTLDREYRPPMIAVIPRTHQRMAEVNIADLHLGKWCGLDETGNAYDSKMAREIFLDIISRICVALKRIGVEYILFVWTHDFFNSDTILKTTTAGTPQSTDLRWQPLYNMGTRMLVTGIDLMRQIAPVRSQYTASNHDMMASYYATDFLSAWYRQDADVQIDTGCSPRKYVQYGINLLGLGHGDKEGKEKPNRERASRLASLMPIEAPEMWGQTRHREFHAAHLHTEQMIQEINGVLVRRISSPTAHDSWHVESGFLGSVRKAQTFIWDREWGNTDIINTPVIL